MRFRFAILVVFLPLLVVGASAFAQARKKVTKAEATQIFVQYAAAKGYGRELEPTPFEVKKWRGEWSAFFRYKRGVCRECHRNTGFLFLMGAYGENIRVLHQAVVLAGPKRKHTRRH
jgi:hypothetical protein